MSKTSYNYLNFIRHVRFASFTFSRWFTRLRVSPIVFLIKNAGRQRISGQLIFATYFYQRYLSTDDPRSLRRAVEILEQVHFPEDLTDPTKIGLRVRGWAALPDRKIKKITFAGDDFRSVVKVNLERLDVAEAHQLPSMAISGFDVILPNVDVDKSICIEVHVKDSHSYFLNLPPTTFAGNFTFYNADFGTEPICAGSIDDVSVSISMAKSQLLSQLQHHEIDLIALAELLSLSHHNSLAQDIVVCFQDLPHCPDTRIDRLRFILDIKPFNEERSIVQTKTFGSIKNSSVLRISNAQIYRNSLTQDQNDTLILNDLAARPEFDFVSGQWEHVSGSPQKLGHASVPTPGPVTLEIPAAVSLLGRNSKNYFHCLIEYLPLIHSYKVSEYFNGHKFLVNGSCPPTVFEALGYFLDDDQIIRVADTDVIIVNELLLASFHTFVPDSTQIGWVKSQEVRMDPINYFADHLIAQLCIPQVPSRNVMAIRRGGARGVLNSSELEAIAQEEGFELVDLMELSLLEQVQLLNATKNFVVPGGSGVANQIFMQPGTAVCALATYEQSSLAVFRSLAEQRGLLFSNIFGKSVAPLGSTPYVMNQYHSDFIVSPRKFRNELQKLKAR